MSGEREIVLIGGLPGCGKSTVAAQFQNHWRLNRDAVGGTLADIADALDRQLAKGYRAFVLDNTYHTVEARAPVVAVAKKHKAPCRMIWMDTSKEDCQVNAVTRMVAKYGKLLSPEEISAARDPNTFPAIVLFAFSKDAVPPSIGEGFDKVEVVHFVRQQQGPAYKNKGIFLDFDGTLRRTKSADKYPKSPDDVEILPNRAAVLKQKIKEGFKLYGVSNQSGVATGELTMEQAKACFDKTLKLLGVPIEVAFCPHAPAPVACYCRKPQVGLGVAFIEIGKLDRSQTVMVGDMTSDKTFGARCGIKFAYAEEFFKQ